MVRHHGIELLVLQLQTQHRSTGCLIALVRFSLDLLRRELAQVLELERRILLKICRAMFEKNDKTERRDQKKCQPEKLRDQPHLATS